MAKVSPTAAEEEKGGPTKQPCLGMAVSRRLTVWCKSLVFRGDGYAVFDDADGRMVFRVDNYGDGGSSMALMDRAGSVLLTVRRSRRKILSLAETWEVYNGDADAPTTIAAVPMMRADKDLCSSSCTVSVAGSDAPAPGVVYRMSWSRREEWLRIHRSGRGADLVAEVWRKRGGPEKTTLLGKDVLSLVVQPGMDEATAMAMLMISNSYR